MICATCNPPLAGTSRVDERHFGVRFGDYGTQWQVLLDGQDVGKRCAEAYAGEDGWVVLVPEGPPDVCHGQGSAGVLATGGVPAPGGHIRTALHRGLVQVLRRTT